MAQYSCKTFKSNKKRVKAIVNEVVTEEIIAHELVAGRIGMCRINPSIKQLIAPILNVAADLQGIRDDVNLKKISVTTYGLWQSSISVNAQTQEFHAEEYCTYTFITVPKKSKHHNGNKVREYNFMFKLNDEDNVSIKLRYVITFLFTGRLLTHRQTCNILYGYNNDLFFNFASYGSKILFSYIRQSFLRNETK